MKWPFLSRLRTSRTSGNLEDAKSPIGATMAIAAAKTGKNKKAGTRRRYRQTRLLDLFCSVRRGRLHTAPSCCSSCMSDHRFGSQDFPMLHAGDPVSSSLESLTDLVRCHSLALHRPIPSFGAKVDRKEISMEWQSMCGALTCNAYQSGTVAPVSVRKEQSSFCPPWHGLVSGTSPKKTNSGALETRSHRMDASVTKRLCPRLESYNPSFIASTPDNETLRSHASMAVSKYDSFDPTYSAVTESGNPTIYSAIADESYSVATPPELDAQLIDDYFVSRPKLIGTRRTAKNIDASRGALGQCLLNHHDFQADNSGRRPYSIAVANTTMVSEPTYDVIDPDLLVVGEPMHLQSSDEVIHAFGAPCMVSTLKRAGTYTMDQGTLYDEVASETDDQTDEVRFHLPQVRVKTRSRRCFPQYSPTQVHDPIKRVRREYFVYEE
ncbi:hypothetical protein FGIG_05513 [Fasciola gigantica]|uniref:Uncharacterized protein n=1 Tax=Fasciola gigantica TaxID=46835 RepID=A0A504YS89_FASGI|nr:hypothetical protein FGIG_05513 [Fasciola gigantica]